MSSHCSDTCIWCIFSVSHTQCAYFLYYLPFDVPPVNKPPETVLLAYHQIYVPICRHFASYALRHRHVLRLRHRCDRHLDAYRIPGKTHMVSLYIWYCSTSGGVLRILLYRLRHIMVLYIYNLAHCNCGVTHHVRVNNYKRIYAQSKQNDRVVSHVIYIVNHSDWVFGSVRRRPNLV